MRRPTRRCFGEGSQRPGSERREHRASPPGYWRQHACKRETEATREALAVARTRQPAAREGQAGPGRVAERSVVPGKPGNAGGGKGPQFESDAGRGKGPVETGEGLRVPDSVRGLQTALHVKAKGDPGFRFYTLSDKVWREDVMAAAWQAVRRNGGACGVDGETFERIEERGVDGWLGGLARELRENSYRPHAVRQVLIPKKQPGKFRPLGIPCIRDRVAQTAAMLVLTPIFEADLQPEQYAYREGRSALDAVRHAHRLANTGHGEIVDGDLSNYFGEIPHAELIRSIARRVSDGRMLGWIKLWLEMAVVEDDGKGGQTPHEPGAPGKERDAARRPDLPVAEQRLHAAVPPGLEAAGPRPAVRRGDSELRGRLRDLRQGPGGSHAGRGRTDHGAAPLAAERDEDPLPADAGGAIRVPRVPHRTQLQSAHGPGLHRHAPEQGERPQHMPQDQ